MHPFCKLSFSLYEITDINVYSSLREIVFDNYNIYSMSNRLAVHQIEKVLKLFYSDKIKVQDAVSAETDFKPIAEQILKHWNDESKRL